MRSYINIITEAFKTKSISKPVAVDTSGFATTINALMHEFSALTDVSIRFKRDWVDLARRAVSAKKIKWESDPDNGPFYYRENLEEIVDKMWNEERDGLISVKSNAEHAEQEYQQRAAERHERDADPDFYIESSDYLRGMNEMVECARDLYHLRPLSSAKIAQQIITRCDRFVKEWDQHSMPSDGGEAPMLDEDFVNVIERLLPLMWFLYSSPTTI